MSPNGQTDSSNDFMLDGMDNNERAIETIIVKPSIDALQEERVETTMYSAEVGRAGGAVINMITKSGTDAFHGTVFEFLRNDLLDAKNFFNVPQPGNPLAGVKPEFRQNQFGGSFGGPIKKDQTFFFVDYEGFRRMQGQTQQDAAPTACELGRATCNGITQLGNFSDSLTLIYNPQTHAYSQIIWSRSIRSARFRTTTRRSIPSCRRRPVKESTATSFPASTRRNLRTSGMYGWTTTSAEKNSFYARLLDQQHEHGYAP